MESEAGEPESAADVERMIGDRPARWWPLAGIWFAIAISLTLGLDVSYRAQGHGLPFGSVLMSVLPHYAVWLLVSPALYRSLHGSLTGPGRALSALQLLAWSAFAVAGSSAMTYLSYVLRHDFKPSLGQFLDLYVRSPAGPAFWVKVSSTLALALVGVAAVRYQRLRDRALWDAAQLELRGARLEAQLAKARLEALQTRINPHFLLNGLNVVAGLVRDRNHDSALDAATQLSRLLQTALRHSRDLNITLGHEAEFIESYLRLCKLRFESSMRYDISIPKSLRNRNLPALIVQPLVENAIRHGMRSSEPLAIEVRAYEHDATVVIEVQDDGRGIDPETAATSSAGHGIANVRERLRLSFGDRAELRLKPRRPRGTCARVSIPA